MQNLHRPQKHQCRAAGVAAMNGLEWPLEASTRPMNGV
jgi:hypothetical protein